MLFGDVCLCGFRFDFLTDNSVTSWKATVVKNLSGKSSQKLEKARVTSQIDMRKYHFQKSENNE